MLVFGRFGLFVCFWLFGFGGFCFVLFQKIKVLILLQMQSLNGLTRFIQLREHFTDQ